MTRLGPLFCALALCLPAAAQDDEGSTQAALVLSVSARGEADAGGTPLIDVRSGRLRAGRPGRFRVSLPAETCVLIAAEARGMRSVQVALTARRQTLAEASDERSAHTIYCHEGPAVAARLEVRARGGSGPFAAGIFQVPREAAEASGATAHEVLASLKEHRP